MKNWSYFIKVVVESPLEVDMLDILEDAIPCGCVGYDDSACTLVYMSQHSHVHEATEAVDSYERIQDALNDYILSIGQQLALVEHQKGDVMHPFTCPRDHAESICLIPGEDHWFCAAQTCDYTQKYGSLEQKLVP